MLSVLRLKIATLAFVFLGTSVTAFESASRFDVEITNTKALFYVFVYEHGETLLLDYYEQISFANCAEKEFLVARSVVRQVNDNVYDPVERRAMRRLFDANVDRIGPKYLALVAGFRKLHPETSPDTLSKREQAVLAAACEAIFEEHGRVSPDGEWQQIELSGE